MSEHEPSTSEALAAEITRHRALYYDGSPELSDAEFDALEDRLRQLDPEHPVLGEVGAPVASAAPRASAAAPADPKAKDKAEALLQLAEAAYRGEPVDPGQYSARFSALEAGWPEHPALAQVPPPQGRDWPKQAHEIPMGSLNKVNRPEELKDWADRCDELAAEASLPPISADLSITEKLDGISIALTYEGGQLLEAVTRGDGAEGERITSNVAHMEGVPAQIEEQARISVRGEIVLRKSAVERYTETRLRVDPRYEGVKSLRNAAAGGARTKELKYLAGCPLLTVLVYEVEGLAAPTEQDKLQRLRALGFSLPSCSLGALDAVEAEHEAYGERKRAALDYDIDGLVVRANQLDSFHKLGELNRRPRAAIAYKFANEMRVSRLLSVEWNTGDTGRVTPIAHIEPVILVGAEIRRVSLHNVANVRGLGIGIGDELLVSRRNDVIPYVEKVVEHRGEPLNPPDRCEACQSTLTANGEYLMCVNPSCGAKRLGRLKTWIKQVGLLEWGERTLALLLDEGLVSEPADLYRLKREQIAALEGFGARSADKLLGPLFEKMALPLPTFIAALGVPSISKETARLLPPAGFGSVEAIRAATVEQLSEVNGLGPIKADKLLSGLSDRAEEIARLLEAGVTVVDAEAGGPLSGLSFCFTGKQPKPRKELTLLVEDNGGEVRSGVGKGLSYLVLADPDSSSSKAQKARKLGTQLIDFSGLEALIAAGRPS